MNIKRSPDGTKCAWFNKTEQRWLTTVTQLIEDVACNFDELKPLAEHMAQFNQLVENSIGVYSTPVPAVPEKEKPAPKKTPGVKTESLEPGEIPF